MTSVLFFGRHGCRHSQGLLDRMQGFGWEVSVCWSREPSVPVPHEETWWRGDYIICFRSLYILPDALLARAGIAINFHPGPPNYRGIGCLNAALYDGVPEYGITCHHMAPEIDSGPIIEARTFPIFDTDDVASLLKRTHEHLHRQACDVVDGIRAEGAGYIAGLESANDREWSGPLLSRKDLDRRQKVDPSASPEEIAALKRAYHTEAHPLRFDLHGYTFVLK